MRLERDFLPPFNEGSVQLNVVLPPGTSLATSNEIDRKVEERLQEIDGLTCTLSAGRAGRTGRTRRGRSTSARYILELDPAFAAITRAAARRDPRSDGGHSRASSPRSNSRWRISSRTCSRASRRRSASSCTAMTSTCCAQVAQQMEADIREVRRGHRPAGRAAGRSFPQLRIELDRSQLLLHGLTPGAVNEFVETAMNGEVVSEVLVGQRTFDLLVRLDESYREDIEALRRLTIDLPDGGRVPLEAVAAIYESGGPNTINRENVRRRIVLQCNVSDRGLVDVVQDIQERLAADHRHAAHRVLRRVRRPVRESAVGLADDWRPVSGEPRWWRVPGAVHHVPLGQPVAAGDGRPADGLHRRGRGARVDRSDADRGRHGRLHLAGGHRVAQRHPAAQPLPAPGEVRRRELDQAR